MQPHQLVSVHLEYSLDIPVVPKQSHSQVTGEYLNSEHKLRFPTKINHGSWQIRAGLRSFSTRKLAGEWCHLVAILQNCMVKFFKAMNMRKRNLLITFFGLLQKNR